MRKINVCRMLIVCLGAAFFLNACSSNLDVRVEDENLPVVENQSGLQVIIKTPVPDKIVMSNYISRAEAGEPIHEAQEWAIKRLGIYIFKKKASGGSTDTDYTLIKKTEGITFVPEKEVGADLPEKQGIDKGNGIYSYTEPIDDSFMTGSKTIKIFMVTNEEDLTSLSVDASGETGTSLADFKKTLAKAELTDNGSSDMISGGAFDASPGASNSSYKGIVMTASAHKGTTASEDGSDEAIEITKPEVIKLNANLTRNLARIDIRLNKRSLVVKKVVLKNTASKAYLFAQGKDKTDAPDDSEYFTMLPTSAYTELGTGYGSGAEEGIVYQAPDSDTEPEEITKEKNTLKHVFYLYEQKNDDLHCATVEVTYTLPDKDGVLQKGVIDIPLKTRGEMPEFVPTTRNNLYTIVLGDGSMDGKILIAELVVEDWIPNDIHDFVGPDVPVEE